MTMLNFKSGKLGGNEVLTGIIEKKEPDSYAGCLMNDKCISCMGLLECL